MFKRKSVLTIVAVLVLVLSSTGGAHEAEEKANGRLGAFKKALTKGGDHEGEEQANGRLGAFKKALTNMGFTVQEGLMDYPELLDMCCRCQIPSCFANNPASPYGWFVLPPAPNQASTVPNPYSEWFTEDQTYPEGWSMFWRLRTDEAIVFLGTTPPEMDYFGFTAYLFDRYRAGIDPPGCPFGYNQIRPTPASAVDRVPLFASLGDTVNNRVIHVLGKKKKPFLKNVVFVLAADRKIERRIRKALHRSGYRDKIINTVVVSPDLVRLGVESDKDSLMFVQRLASEMTPALQQYIDSPKTVLRVSPREPIPPSALDPMPLPKLRVRGTGSTEVSLLPLVEQLGQAIVAAYPEYDATPILTVNWYEGYNCIENRQNCLGDNRDTPYIPPSFNPFTYTPHQNLVLETGEFYVAYGVNHKASGKATYSNVSILGWKKKASPVMISNEDMAGSASSYLGLSPDDPTANLLYAYVVARPGSCVGDPKYCREVGYDCMSGVADDEPLALVFRAYMEPATRVAPAYSEIVIDRIIKFTPKP
ncbi:MAG: hypothetical protein JSU72_16260 [Deltaproteobacteria bacterium]|nr:MAG: hypothetical protein JSU72_16260 [Deltaproteobacteria bacterium]